MNPCTVNVTKTSRVKYTVTVSGDIRIKVNSQHLVDIERYKAIGQFIAEQLKKNEAFVSTMRGQLRPGHQTITMYNDCMKRNVVIEFSL